MNQPVFPVALKLERRPVLLIGGDAEAADKLPKLSAAGARVTLVAPDVEASLARAALHRRLIWYRRAWCETDLIGQASVILTSCEPGEAARLWALRGRYGFLLCAIDLPAFCDFFMMSTVQRGPVQIAITTGGAAPLLARRIRRALETGLDDEFADFCRDFAQLRAQLKSLPKAERAARLEASLNGFAMEVGLRYPEQVGSSARAEPGATRGR